MKGYVSHYTMKVSNRVKAIDHHFHIVLVYIINVDANEKPIFWLEDNTSSLNKLVISAQLLKTELSL